MQGYKEEKGVLDPNKVGYCPNLGVMIGKLSELLEKEGYRISRHFPEPTNQNLEQVWLKFGERELGYFVLDFPRHYILPPGEGEGLAMYSTALRLLCRQG